MGYGSTWFQRAEPHRGDGGRQVLVSKGDHIVALQVEFERQTLKPVFHLIGFRLSVWKVIGYGLWVNLIRRAEPHHIRLGVLAIPFLAFRFLLGGGGGGGERGAVL
jgi:hypothetical protein